MKITRTPLIIIVLLLTVVFPAHPVIADDTAPQLGPAVESAESLPAIQFSGCNPVAVAAVNAAYEQRVVEMVNAERSKVGLPPLKRSTELDGAARFHARDMAEDAYFNHDTYDRTGGNLTLSCSWIKRIEAFYPARSWLGENIAAGYGSPEEVMQGWMNSTGHRGNILHTEYREFGVGYYSGGTYGNYWVQDFGSRSSTYPLVIERENAISDSPDVDLYLYGAGVWNEMRLKNDSGAWSTWRPFQSEFQWRLEWTQGTHTVSVELRKTGQTSAGAASSDTILLTNTGAELGNLPDQIFFLYNLADQQLIPGPVQLNPQNVLSSLPLEWQVSSVNNWIKISNGSGSTPSGSVVIQPGDDALRHADELSGVVTVSVTSGVQAVGSPKEIAVRLVVVPDLPHHQYLPIVTQ